jgi:hypothetical protein
LTKPTDENGREARKTAILVASVLLAIASWNFYRARLAVATFLCGAGCALLLMGLLLPTWARRFHTIWMKLAALLGYVNSRILLSLTFYGIFTPYGFISRLVGRDPLRRRSKEISSYWIPRKTPRQSKEQFERLF